MNPFPKNFIALGLGALVMAMSPGAQADDRYAPVTDKTVQKFCGGCHMAYQPEMLPARSWRALLSGMSDHFGAKLSVPDDVMRHLSDYHQSKAADAHWWGGKFLRGIGDSTPLRITETPYWRREHREHTDIGAYLQTADYRGERQEREGGEYREERDDRSRDEYRNEREHREYREERREQDDRGDRDDRDDREYRKNDVYKDYRKSMSFRPSEQPVARIGGTLMERSASAPAVPMAPVPIAAQQAQDQLGAAPRMDPSSNANCPACHRGAKQGSYDDD